MKNVDLGIDTEQVIAIDNISHIQKQNFSAIKQELLKLPEISSVSTSHHLPGGAVSGQMFRLYGSDPKTQKILINIVFVPIISRLWESNL